jgi:hypothetical protein
MKSSIASKAPQIRFALAVMIAALAFSISTPSEEVECDMGKVCSLYINNEEKLGSCGKRVAVGYEECICTAGSYSQDQPACKKTLYE